MSSSEVPVRRLSRIAPRSVVRRLDDVYHHARSIITTIHTFCSTRLEFVSIISFLLVLELLSDSSGIAQMIEDITRALSTQDYAQVRHSAYSLSTHTAKVGFLLWCFFFRYPSVKGTF
jgi:hypothetical protein